jgi:hypothetical protein
MSHRALSVPPYAPSFPCPLHPRVSFVLLALTCQIMRRVGVGGQTRASQWGHPSPRRHCSWKAPPSTHAPEDHARHYTPKHSVRQDPYTSPPTSLGNRSTLLTLTSCPPGLLDTRILPPCHAKNACVGCAWHAAYCIRAYVYTYIYIYMYIYIYIYIHTYI